jgi:Flp pilus assembly protein TadD
MIPVFRKRKWLAMLLFAVLGFLVYSNTFDASFHFDDTHVLSALSFEDMLEKCKGGGSRVICHLTFLLNYWIGDIDVVGYHIFNTIIHVGTACFVFIFLFQILSVSYPTKDKSEQKRINHASNQHTDRLLPHLSDPIFWPALFGGLLFLVHPLATQAVTYITQRYASLAGFFDIGSLACFVSARIRFKKDGNFLKGSHLVRYLCSFGMAVLAMRTKEMAITLPATALLTEYYLIQSDFRRAKERLLYLLPLLSTGLIIPFSDMIGVETISLESVAALQDYTWAAGTEITRKDYLLTQFKVILGIYLKLMVWPIGQNVEHDYVVSKTFFDLPTMGSFLVLCVILMMGLWLFKRARLISFGIVWFFVTISPTSSIVPNTEFVAEHRAYISLMGLAFVGAGLPSWHSRWKRYVTALLPVLLIFSSLTYARNKVWQTDLSLWQDSVAKSLKRARPHYNLGVALQDSGRLDEAISHYSATLRIKPGYVQAHNNLGNAMLDQGHAEDAIVHYREAFRLNPDYAEARYNLGGVLLRQGKLEEAISHFSRAVQTSRLQVFRMVKAHNNLGIALARQGKLEEAISHFSKAVQLKPQFATAHNNLGIALTEQGRLEEAIVHYSKALQIKSDYADARRNLQRVLRLAGK